QREPAGREAPLFRKRDQRQAGGEREDEHLPAEAVAPPRPQRRGKHQWQKNHEHLLAERDRDREAEARRSRVRPPVGDEERSNRERRERDLRNENPVVLGNDPREADLAGPQCEKDAGEQTKTKRHHSPPEKEGKERKQPGRDDGRRARGI